MSTKYTQNFLEPIRALQNAYSTLPPSLDLTLLSFLVNDPFARVSNTLRMAAEQIALN